MSIAEMVLQQIKKTTDNYKKSSEALDRSQSALCWMGLYLNKNLKAGKEKDKIFLQLEALQKSLSNFENGEAKENLAHSLDKVSLSKKQKEMAFNAELSHVGQQNRPRLIAFADAVKALKMIERESRSK